MSLPNESQPLSPRIAIIGAGVSGLATAWYCQRLIPKADVHLFEASGKTGGVIQTNYVDPYLVELGADNFATLLPDAWQMVKDQGLESEFVSPKAEHRIAQVVRAGKLIPIPNGFSLMQPTRMAAILTTPVLSWSARLRVLGEYWIKARTSDEDESVESFAVRRLGRECFDRLVEPIVGGIFTARAETLSMQAAMPQFVKMERDYGGLIRAALAKRRSVSKTERSARQASGARYDQFVAPKQGMSWWLGQIASSLGERIRLNTSVVSIEKLPDNKWRLLSRSDDGAVLTLGVFDAICIALPSPKAAEILRPSHRKVANLLDRIPYASSAIAVLAIKRSEIRPNAFCFGAIVPKTENRDSLAISLTSEKYEGRCPSDTVLARVFMGGAIRPELLDRSDDHLLGIAKKEVEELFGPSSLPRWQSLVRWNDAMPQYMVGHNTTIQSVRDALADEPSLRLVGNAYDGVGVPQCVRLAKQTANHFAKLFDSVSDSGGSPS